MAIDKDNWKLYERQAEIVQTIAHPIRLAVADYLSNGEKCVCDIVEHLGAQRSNVSRHLSVMLKAGVLECRKEGLKVVYSLRTPCIMEFIHCVDRALCERIRQESALLQTIESRG